MNKIFLSILFCSLLIPVGAQRFGYVDTDYILENLPEYVQAQNNLRTKTEQWNREIQTREDILNQRQADFLNEKVLLTEEQIKKEEENLEFERKEIQNLREKRYGQGGDLIKLRVSLVKPIQDQIYLAVDQVAKKKNYSFIFDKGSDLIMIYTDPKFDISRDVLLELNPNAVIKDPKQPNPKPKSTGTNTKGRSTPAKGATPSKGATPANRSNAPRQLGTGTGTKSLK
ncbi:MAG: OmpH family outer membrane protein [Moheibacter sp.]